jgi:hypothetical protein
MICVGEKDLVCMTSPQCVGERELKSVRCVRNRDSDYDETGRWTWVGNGTLTDSGSCRVSWNWVLKLVMTRMEVDLVWERDFG